MKGHCVTRQNPPAKQAAGAVPSRSTNVGLIEVNVQYCDLEELILDPRNPRQHSQKQIGQIADSIREFGFIAPVVIDDRSNVIIGHGRVLAAKKLRMAKVPAIELHHLSPAQLKALKIADNKLALNAHWDERLLGESLLEIKELDLEFDLTVTGFALPEIDLAIEDLKSGKTSVEEVESTTGAPVCRLGDLWNCGDHLVFCGDATDGTSFQALMDGKLANLVFVDPPYNVSIRGDLSDHGKIKHREFAQGSGELSREEFTAFLVAACSLLQKHSMNGSVHFVCMDWRHTAELIAAGNQIYTELKNINVWVKSNAGMGSLYRSQHEFVFVFKNGSARHTNNIALGKYGRHRTNVWNYDGANTQARRGDNLLALHPTAKPVHLVMDAMFDCSDRADIVLDSFLGSGTTLLAAERTGRICRAIELDPLYVDTAIRRWQNLTGLEAKRVSDGKSFRELEAEVDIANG
jgi:DNA modification methylase